MRENPNTRWRANTTSFYRPPHAAGARYFSADVFDFNTTPSDKVGIGSVVWLETDKGESLTCTILGAWDSDTTKNYFSYQTPLAQALLEHKKGDTVETNINGHVNRWTIKDLARYIDKQAAK
ncbi:MAG: GreA/GreB family elongation factor [Bacilli bacterium]